MDEPVLPDIEKPETSKTLSSKNIDLEDNLTATDVNQIDTEILDELSEFSNLLNIDDDIDGLPLAVTNNSTLDSAFDLEIEMDNTKFLEQHPVVSATSATTTGSVDGITAYSSASNAAHLVTSAENVNSANMGRTVSSGTPCNSKTPTAVLGKPTAKKTYKGTVQITTHVLRRPTPEEAKTKKFTVVQQSAHTMQPLTRPAIAVYVVKCTQTPVP